MSQNPATLDRKTREAAELSLKSKRRYERFGSMNEFLKDGTDGKDNLVISERCPRAHARRW